MDQNDILVLLFKDRDAAREALVARPKLINKHTSWGETLLHYVAIEDNIEAVRMLLELGADVDAPDETGATPLSSASALGSCEIVSVLLSAGANPDVRQDWNWPLINALEYGHMETAELLLQAGATCIPGHSFGHNLKWILNDFLGENRGAAVELLERYWGAGSIQKLLDYLDTLD